MADIDYTSYTNKIEALLNVGDLSSFKSEKEYHEILEHVTYAQGNEYLQCLSETNIKKNDIQFYCAMNDRYGAPIRYEYGNLTTSPTSLRYVWHAHLILSYLREIQKYRNDILDIVEVGGGYGGLCLAIHFFADQYNVRINSYTILDLNQASRLQEAYLSNFALSFKTYFVDATSFGKDIQRSNMFLISNYCFSEISSEFQKEYLHYLFPKVAHGFMAWNMIPLYNFRHIIRSEVERPKTGALNQFVYF